MILFIIAGAAFLTAATGFTGVPHALVGTVSERGLSPAGLLVALTVVFLMMGCFIGVIARATLPFFCLMLLAAVIHLATGG